MDGVIIVNKPAGMTSHDVVNRIRKIFKTKKVGHCGTLDPDATGVLVVAVNKATKLLQFLTADNKEYIATLSLGTATDTYDASGQVTATKEYVPISDKKILACLNSFVGEQEQIPPMHSAIKVKGKKLYEYARSGIEVELPKKEVTIKKIKLLSSDNDTFMIKALVTKGCYIRSLVRDIGLALDTYATMTTLQRTKQGKIGIKQTNTLEEIKEGNLTIHTMDEVLDFPVIIVDNKLERKIKTGQKIPNNYKIKDKVIFKNTNNEILGIYKVERDKLRVWKNF